MSRWAYFLHFCQPHLFISLLPAGSRACKPDSVVQNTIPYWPPVFLSSPRWRAGSGRRSDPRVLSCRPLQKVSAAGRTENKKCDWMTLKTREVRGGWRVKGKLWLDGNTESVRSVSALHQKFWSIFAFCFSPLTVHDLKTWKSPCCTVLKWCMCGHDRPVSYPTLKISLCCLIIPCSG